jgi:uncharacterized cofD-like protein
MTQKAKEPQVVVMGGGTGTFPVISALKHFPVKISTIICVSDSGGSTGRIRDEFGFQPVGDLRQSLAALAENKGEDWIRKILLYRFAKGKGLEGHNLGNLILTALQDMTGDTSKALEIMERVFRLEGRVIPVTKDLVNLKIDYADGSSAVGEHILDEATKQPKVIADIELVPHATLNPLAGEAIEQADVIIIGPGDYYASLMAVLVTEGSQAAFARTKAKIVYVSNLMTRLTQTHHMTAADHVKGIEAKLGRPVDVIMINNQQIPAHVLELYELESEFPVVDDLGDDPRVVRQGLVSESLAEKAAHDTAHRSLLRHDQTKLITIFAQMFGWQVDQVE